MMPPEVSDRVATVSLALFHYQYPTFYTNCCLAILFSVFTVTVLHGSIPYYV